jgi:hypothetical protein
MNISPRTTRRSLESRVRSALRLAVLAVTLLTGAAPATAALRCELNAPASGRAGAPLLLHFKITNSGSQGVRVLDWNTPFEPGWFAPFVTVSREGQPVTYRGASMKRGDPAASDYLAIGAGRTRHARIDLAEAFDLSRPGHYRVEPQIMLHDVLPAGTPAPRARDAHQALPLACNAAEVDLR